MTLAEHLAQIGQTAYQFFKQHDLQKDVVYNACKGKPVSYASAKRIRGATGDVVSLDSLIEPESR